MMRVLLIDKNAKHEAKKVIAYAEKNIVTLAKVKLMMARDLPPVGDNPNHIFHIHNGYRVVFSIEEQPFGLCNHISVSIESKHKYPNPHAIEEILKLLNMDCKLKNSLKIWQEEEWKAINIIQKRNKNGSSIS